MVTKIGSDETYTLDGEFFYDPMRTITYAAMKSAMNRPLEGMMTSTSTISGVGVSDACPT